MRIYISGPMTGIKDYNYPSFNFMAKELRADGHEVCNPAEFFGGDATRTRPEYIRESIVRLLECELVVTLPGWELSEGACLEVQIARELEYQIVHHGE